MIPFHKAYRLDLAMPYLEQVLALGRTEGDGPKTEDCRLFLSKLFAANDVLMMTSGTHALEAALHALKLETGDEVILPSFCYPSAANAVILAGGTVVYGEVEPVHLTLDPTFLESHITPRTRAVIAVHYGGNCCDMDAINLVAIPRKLAVIEDCAQSFMSFYKGQLSGTLGTFGCFSFHGTKDVVAGEGGFLLVNDPAYARSARQFRQKGTDRDAYLQRLVSHYQWVSSGSSYVPGELTMALLRSQLELSAEIVRRKRDLFFCYQTFLSQNKKVFKLSKWLDKFSTEAIHSKTNGHLFYLLFKEADTANSFIQSMSVREIETRTHFVPLHESKYGQDFIRPENQFTVENSIGQRLVRLPLFADLTPSELAIIQDAIKQFFDRQNG